jgi:hypothetical protein
MTTEIKSWEIVDGRLVPVDNDSLITAGERHSISNRGWRAILPSFDLA